MRDDCLSDARRRSGWSLTGAALVACLVLIAAPSAHAEGSCPNEEFRTGPSANLSDCRAYEQSSPVDKNGADAQGFFSIVQASESGNAVTYGSHAAMPGLVGNQTFPVFIARRGSENWTAAGILPPSAFGEKVLYRGWTPDLEHTFTSAGPVTAPPSQAPAFVDRDSSTGEYTVIHPPAEGRIGQASILVGASTDGSKVYFQNRPISLAPGAAPEVENLYVWNRKTGAIKVAGALPGADCEEAVCAPESGAFAGPYRWPTAQRAEGGIRRFFYVQNEHAVSASGNAVFFTSAEAAQLYVRLNATAPDASTRLISASQREPEDPNGPQPAIFWGATASGSEAFFTSCEKLTEDSTAHSLEPGNCEGHQPGEGQELYAYDVSSGNLRDLTVDGSDPEGGDVIGVLGISDDGSYIYFLANGDLDGTGPGTLGDCQYEGGEHLSGSCDIYVWHNGSISFVSGNGAVYTSIRPNGETPPSDDLRPSAEVSRDGSALLFVSTSDAQYYRFKAPTDELQCVTCDPSGVLHLDKPVLHSVEAPGEGFLSINAIRPRNISDDGNRVFFESPDRLVSQDTNGISGCPEGRVAFRCQDVYEWEAAGAGSCAAAETNGCVYLISTGKASEPSYFADASSSGNDVFFFTRESLTPSDKDPLVDVYDARVDGGLASQHLTEPPPCEPSAGACEGPGTNPAGTNDSGTARFVGPGNKAKPARKRSKHHHKRAKHKSRHRHREQTRRIAHRQDGRFQ